VVKYCLLKALPSFETWTRTATAKK